MSYKLFVYNCTSYFGDLLKDLITKKALAIFLSHFCSYTLSLFKNKTSTDACWEFRRGFDGIFIFSSAFKNPNGYISFLKNFVNAKKILFAFHCLKSKYDICRLQRTVVDCFRTKAPQSWPSTCLTHLTWTFWAVVSLVDRILGLIIALEKLLKMQWGAFFLKSFTGFQTVYKRFETCYQCI